MLRKSAKMCNISHLDYTMSSYYNELFVLYTLHAYAKYILFPNNWTEHH